MTTKPLVGRAKVAAMRGLHSPALMTVEQLDFEVQALLHADTVSARRWACKRPGCNGLPHQGWRHKHARASQRPPAGDWETWLMMTGRGWGKTRTGAETCRFWEEEAVRGLHIAVVARKDTLAREICFEHRKSGLLAVIPESEIKEYNKSIGDLRLTLNNGTVFRGFGANEPDNLRGWEFDKAWLDEFAAWNRKTAQEVLDMIWFCLREADDPQVVISTTPKAMAHIKKLVNEHKDEMKALAAAGIDKEPAVRLTTGHMTDNQANLSDIAIRRLMGSYDGTRLGNQELAGDLLEDVEGALWKAWMLEGEGFRIPKTSVPELERIVVAVDPAVTSTETADENGFAVCARGYERDFTHKDSRPRGFVLHSEAFRATPSQTMKHAAELYHRFKADAVILEANNGGEYLSTVLRMVDPTVNYRIVHASRDKRSRAAPVAGLYEQGRIHHVGPAKDFDALETAQTTYVGAAESQEKSPDILDAEVWALTDLFLDSSSEVGNVDSSDERLKGRR